ncbi:MAG: hypothetical protein KatS3mg122_1310 [Caldimonas sp.]|nr:MAG: hypothetical protein KatS3mg122_1310 [Caldimonas sp.]
MQAGRGGVHRALIHGLQGGQGVGPSRVALAQLRQGFQQVGLTALTFGPPGLRIESGFGEGLSELVALRGIEPAVESLGPLDGSLDLRLQSFGGVVGQDVAAQGVVVALPLLRQACELVGLELAGQRGQQGQGLLPGRIAPGRQLVQPAAGLRRGRVLEQFLLEPGQGCGIARQLFAPMPFEPVRDRFTHPGGLRRRETDPAVEPPVQQGGGLARSSDAAGCSRPAASPARAAARRIADR